MARISVEHLCVEFAVLGSSSRSLKNTLMAQATGGRIMASAHSPVRVRAIDDLSLEVRDGDRVALVGHNGSGKTTLLRALAGIYKPASGLVRVDGRLDVLLDPAAGMDDDATGVENIFLRGYVLGFTKRKIESQLADIAEFTGLGHFLELPMKTYSAGMRARLMFAISTALDHDILLVDEGIGAGDEAFQDKARARIDRVFARTSIVVMASHDEELISRVCNRRVRFEQGRLVSDERMSPSVSSDTSLLATEPQDKVRSA